MDGFWCSVLFYGILLLLLIQSVRFVLADADLSLLFMHRFGSQPEKLAGRTVWITGASSGIGEYLAYELAKAGCKLVLSARNISELKRVKKQCQMYGNVQEDAIIVKRMDLLQYESHEKIVTEVLDVVPKIDILVNNSGVSQRALIKDTCLQVDKQLMDVNYLGTVSVTKALLPHFIQNRSGHVVVTSSVAGKLGAPVSASYSASKFALQGWFETLRTEHGEQGIDVTLVCPGPVYSNITKVALTGEEGKVFGETQKPSENRMKTERCAELMVTAIANKMEEVWISNQPILAVTYIFQYAPSLGRWLAKKAGMKLIRKVREN